jgi:hypothetical protein
MSFKTEILDALRAGADHEMLLYIIRRFKATGGTQRETYKLLQDIWIELGFNEDAGEETNKVRDELEYVMELVWGFCSRQQSLWETSLHNNP